MHVYRRRSALALAVTLVAVACSDTLSDAIIPGFYADMTSDQLVPAAAYAGISGHIDFTTGADSGLTVSGNTMTALTGNPTSVAVYTGAPGAAGTLRGYICGGTAPACAATIAANTAVLLTAPYTKGQFYTALHTYGNGYVQVNTAAHAAGEIRGVIVFKPLQ